MAAYTMSKTYETVIPSNDLDADISEMETESGFEYENQPFDSLAEMAKEVIESGFQFSTNVIYGGNYYGEPVTDMYSGETTRHCFHPNLSQADTAKFEHLLRNKKRLSFEIEWANYGRPYWAKYKLGKQNV